MGLQATHRALTLSRTNLFRKDYCKRTSYAPYQVSRYGIGGQGIQHVSRTDLQGTSSGGGTEEREQQVPHIPRRLHQFGTSTIQAN